MVGLCIATTKRWTTQHNSTQYRDNQEMDQEDPPTVSLPRSKPQDYNEHIEDVDDIEDIDDIDEDEVLQVGSNTCLLL